MVVLFFSRLNFGVFHWSDFHTQAAPFASDLAWLLSLLSKMSDENPGYKKWRFNTEEEPSRSTLWRRRKRKRKLDDHNNGNVLNECEISHIQPDSMISYGDLETSNTDESYIYSVDPPTPCLGKYRYSSSLSCVTDLSSFTYV